MKILALGDVHLGAGTDLGRVPFGEGSRLGDQSKVLARIAKLAEDEGVDLVLFAGDAFHRRRPTPSEILAWRGFVERLNLGGVDMIAIDGNHDVESAERPSALQILLQHSGYQVSRTPTLLHPTPLITVATLPWTPPARLLASLNGDVARDEVNTRVAELLIDSARELRAQISTDKVAILMLHWSISGSSLPNGLDVGLLREPVLPLPDLAGLGFDAIVASHIHKPQRLDMGLGSDCGPILYTGSPALVDFGESKTAHGVWVLDTETMESDRGVFHEIEDRRFLTVDVDLTAERHDELGLDETDAIAAAIATQFPVEDAVLRIRYRATSEQARRVDTAALRSLCVEAGVSKLYAIQPTIEREDRARVEGVDEHLAPMEALELYIAENFESIARRNDLRDLTSRLLEEVAA